MKKARHLFEYMFVLSLFGIFRVLPAKTASDLGGALARFIGPKLGASKKALRNIQMVLPEKDIAEQNAILKGMWDNLGRVFTEYPHLKTLGESHMIVDDKVNLSELNKTDKPIIFFGAHWANWEVAGSASMAHMNVPAIAVYRAPNNPYIDRLLNRARLKGQYQGTIPKSKSGSKNILKALNNNDNIAFLIDQKYNEGSAYDFMGHSAMTADMFARLAQKYDAHLVPVCLVREKKARFKMTLPSVVPTHTNGAPRPIKDIVDECHTILEQNIRANPEQWLWLHRRWIDS